jgi:tRNA threonylcarbamoyladenosine biosynthesis protein TsaB
VLILAFDTATDVATSALLDGTRLLGERTGAARSLLVDVDALLVDGGASPGDLEAIVVGTGPGSFTSTRIGLAVARGLGVALGIPGAGISTLDALAASATDAVPVIDARRHEVFVSGPRALSPDELELEPGALCVGNGAVRYRATFESLGAVVPPDGDDVHLPRARLHASLAADFGPVEEIEPVYVRLPDAKAATA